MPDTVTVPRPASLSARLWGATGGGHEDVEARLGLPSRLRSEADLARLLVAWRLVWAEVRAGAQAEWRPAGHDESARLLVSAVRAVQRLRADLADLHVDGLGPDDVEPADGPFPGAGGAFAELLSTEPGVWAVSYVLRGSRTGALTLAPLISRQLELPPGFATCYHDDDAPAATWAAFRRRLDSWGRFCAPAAQERAVEDARVTSLLVAARIGAALPDAKGPGR